MSVSHTSVCTFVDSVPVTDFGYPMGGYNDMYDFASTSSNLAYPDGPLRLSSGRSSCAAIDSNCVVIDL